MRGLYLYRVPFFIMLSVCFSCSEADKYSLSPHAFVIALHQESGQLIDIRERADWEQEHLAGAMQLSISSPNTFKRSIYRLDRRQVYYIYCQNGQSSTAALRFMREAGFTRVYQLRGGLQSLQQEGYSIASLL